MAHKKRIIGLGIVLLAAFIAVMPFFGRGFLPTHDGEYHVIRFVEFDRMMRAGYLFPRWSPTLNSGYGLPLFQFMYPLVNYIASGLHLLGLDFVTTFKVSSALAYLISVFFCFLWLKKRFGLYSAVIGSVASSFVPYWFVELYVRGSVGEFWALAALFAVLCSIELGWPSFTAVAVTILVLSHNILAMIFFPLVLVYILWRRNWKWLLWPLLGVGISAWFWLPALAEAKYMQGLNTVNFHDHFATLAELLVPSWGTEFSGALGGNKMSFQIGIGPLLWMISAAGIVLWRKHLRDRKEVIFVLIATFLIVLLMLPWSMSIWDIVPLLKLTQYPWRFLVYIIPVTAYLAAYVSHVVKKRWVTIGLVILTVCFSISYTRGAVYEPRNDAYYLGRSNFTNGTSSMGNSLSTIWTGWKETAPASGVLRYDGSPLPYKTLYDRYLNKQYEVDLKEDTSVRLPVLYFAGWSVSVDDTPVAIDYMKNGTLDFMVPSGRHVIAATMRETPVRMVSDIVSIISLALLSFWGILHLYAHRH